MSLSRTYPEKSNAARAAKAYGLSRADLVEVEGGWSFEIPEGGIRQQAVHDAPVGSEETATDAAGEPTGTDTAPEAEAPASKPAKAKRKAAAKPANKAKAKKAKAAKKPKAKKAKAAGPKRKAGPRTGIVAEVISELKARWTPADSILKKTGWVSNTFRGILGAHKKKTGQGFEHKRVDGVTYYRIAA